MIDERGLGRFGADAVVDASPVAIFCLAPDREVLVWSRSAEQIFGYTAAEAVGRPYMLVAPEHEAEHQRLFARAMAGETLRGVRQKRRRKDGALIDIKFELRPDVRTGEGESRGLRREQTSRRAIN